MLAWPNTTYLVHQFKEEGFPDIAFELGTTQALFVGEFLYANSSKPSNFTVFAFRKQEPNSNNCQQDYLICHLLRVEGQKKSLEEINASLKQAVHVPSIYNGLEIQILLFCTTNLWQLLLLVSRNKNSFRDQIALNEFFAAKFLFAIDRRAQRWLRSYKQA
jgi:hypothetical protein